MARTKRPSKLDLLEESASQLYAHQHTVTINSRRRVLEFEAEETERAIVALSSSLAHQRRKKLKLEAALRGLAAVVAKR